MFCVWFPTDESIQFWFLPLFIEAQIHPNVSIDKVPYSFRMGFHMNLHSQNLLCSDGLDKRLGRAFHAVQTACSFLPVVHMLGIPEHKICVCCWFAVGSFACTVYKCCTWAIVRYRKRLALHFPKRLSCH